MTFSARLRAPSDRRPRAFASVLVVSLFLLSAALYPPRERLFAVVATWSADSSVGPVVGIIAEFGLLVLVVAAAVVAVRATATDDRRALSRLVAGGVGVVVAYAASEAIKIVVAEPRPCSIVAVSTVLDCPAAGDWSWPSNHSVLAAGFATACVLAASRSLPWLAPTALLVAAARVGAGVHYPHDVVAGLALGVIVVVAIERATRPVVIRCVDTGPGLLRRDSPDRGTSPSMSDAGATVSS